MSVNFSSLPYHIQLLVAKKMDIAARANFEGASEVTMAMAKRVRTLKVLSSELSGDIVFFWHKNEIYYSLHKWVPKSKQMFNLQRHHQLSKLEGTRFHATRITICGSIDEKLCLGLTEFFKTSGSTAKDLFIEDTSDCYHEKIRCSQSAFNELLESAKVQYVDFKGHMIRDWFRNISESVSGICGNLGLKDEDLINSKLNEMNLDFTRVTDRGLHGKMLTDWVIGEREIVNIHLDTEQRFTISSIFDGIHVEDSRQERNKWHGVVESVNGQRLRIRITKRGRVGLFDAVLEGYRPVKH